MQQVGLGTIPKLEDIRVCLQHSPGSNTCAVYREFIADMDTPLTILVKLRRFATSQGAEHHDHCFLLESVEGGERLARYSLVGTAPSQVLVVGEGGSGGSGSASGGLQGDPLVPLEQALSKKIPLVVPTTSLPAFSGGAVGYVGYDCVRYFEPRVAPTVGAQEDVLGIPEALFMLVDTLVVFDHVRHTIKVVSHMDIPVGWGGEGGAAALEAAYGAACAKIEALQAFLAHPVTVPQSQLLPLISPISPPRGSRQRGDSTPPPDSSSGSGGGDSPTAVSSGSGSGQDFASWEGFSNVGQAGYEGMVHRVKEHIVEGDVIQAVASHRISKRIPPGSGVTALDMYRQLRILNPSPYMFYMECGKGFTIVGASPEMLVKVDKEGTLTTHPIAGTRRRGRTPSEDTALATELLGDAKERAEHIMLVDLGRNDIGRVASPGTVRVESLMHIERYSHVMHIVSNVSGALAKPRCSPFDAFRAVFPAGTVSGAPKVRAVEIVAGMEPCRRGVYAGAIGCFGYDGAIDTAIAIRTLVVLDDVVHLQAGAGIVFDSQPTAEYQETLVKMGATMRAVEAAIKNAVGGGASLY